MTVPGRAPTSLSGHNRSVSGCAQFPGSNRSRFGRVKLHPRGSRPQPARYMLHRNLAEGVNRPDFPGGTAIGQSVEVRYARHGSVSVMRRDERRQRIALRPWQTSHKRTQMSAARQPNGRRIAGKTAGLSSVGGVEGVAA